MRMRRGIYEIRSVESGYLQRQRQTDRQIVTERERLYYIFDNEEDRDRDRNNIVCCVKVVSTLIYFR